MSNRLGPLDGLTSRAEALAGAWAGRARASTTLGRERALLRLFGVHGLDRAGRPLAWSVVGRYLGTSPVRLADGIALPFAMALLEYDLGPQQVALDIASGAIDLALEAELLRQPDRRAVAEAEASRLGAAALERVDANRTARRELLAVFGDAPRPWVGLTLAQETASAACGEAGQLVASGADVVRVEVPMGQELAERLERAGIEPTRWRPPEVALQVAAGGDEDLAPTGSQRGVGQLRHALDESAAARHGYVRLATSAPGLWAPEQAVVAGFERVDLVEADPIAEIVEGVDPARALADHAFARSLLRRSGSAVLVGAGPHVVGPDLARGEPSDTTTRAGRAVALQALSVALARAEGFPADQLILGAIPAWLLEERDGLAHALAGAAIRQALYPDHGFALEEPDASAPSAAAWPFMVASALAGALPATLVARRPPNRRSPGDIGAIRWAAAAADAGVRVRGPATLDGGGQELARGVVAAAISTLDALADDGWRAILGEPIGGNERGRLGGDGVVERTEAFDPLALAAAV